MPRARPASTEPEPTRDHTERMLTAFGYSVRRQATAHLPHRRRTPARLPTAIPADISSAAFFLVGASIAPGSDLLLEAVGINPTRVGVINILRAMGADIEVLLDRARPAASRWPTSASSARLRGIRIPEDQVPLAIDEFPAIFIAAACAEGETVLTGAEELRVKESDRIQVMADGLTKLGIQAEPPRTASASRAAPWVQPRRRTIDSPRRPPHRHVLRHRRTAAGGPIEMRDCANVETSFPGFPNWRRRGLGSRSSAGMTRYRSSPSTAPPAPARARSCSSWPSGSAGTRSTAARSIGCWGWPPVVGTGSRRP
jgi:3-phosphoshikimate 1-carboxyvinyltransferase